MPGALARLLALLARPVHRAQGRGGLVIEAYRGYGSREKAFLIGRVFRQSTAQGATARTGILAHLRDIGRRIGRRKVAGATVSARLGATTAQTTTDRDGFFRFDLDLVDPPPADRSWHAVALRLEAEPPVLATGAVYVPRGAMRCVVVSDIDDTVMYTGVGNTLAMLWRLFVADARSRTAFPGVAALYRALHDGPGGDEDNPVLYVSRAPWGTYDMLTAFFRRHGIPVGPELFLREWGLSWRHPLPRRAEHHKRDLIGNMLALYADTPFVLIGDSGQHDPEVYAGLVRDHPGRVMAVYIRNVSRDPGRSAEIEALAQAVAMAGSTLVLTADTAVLAENAAALGLIAPDAVPAVKGDRIADGEDAPPDRPRIHVPGAPGTATGERVGALLGTAQGRDGAPPNLIVNPSRDTPRRPGGDGEAPEP